MKKSLLVLTCIVAMAMMIVGLAAVTKRQSCDSKITVRLSLFLPKITRSSFPLAKGEKPS